MNSLPTSPVYPKQAKPIAWFQYLAVLRRKWWIIPASLALTAGLAITYLQLRIPKFKSEAVMWVTGSLQLPDGARYTEDLQNFFGTQIEIIQSDAMIDRAVKRLKAQDPKLEFPKNQEGKLIVPLLKITQNPKSAVFSLECRDTNGPLAQSFLNALMDEFLAYKGEVRAATSGGALASVSDQVYKQEQELKAEQDRLNVFQRKNNVALLEEQVRDGGLQLGQLKNQLAMNNLELQLMEAAALEQTAPGAHKTNLFAQAPDPRALITPRDSSDTTLPMDYLTVHQQVQVLKTEREQLSRYMKVKHPRIIKLDEEIARGERVIEHIREESMDQIATSKQALIIRIRSLEAAIKELEKRVSDADQQYADYDKIKANIVRLQGFEDRLLTLLQGVDINRNVNQENVTVLQRADEPMPASLHPLIILAAAFLLGCCGSMGLVFVAVRFDDRFESIEALRHHFAEEIVGQIPEVKVKRGDKKAILLHIGDSRHNLLESYRNLRSSLLYWPLERGQLKTLLVTSAAPEEGKSTIAANLARVLAMGGARVLLVDSDLRRGCLHELLGVNPEPGLPQLIQQDADPKSFLLETDLKNLSFLPRGNQTTDCADLFLRPSFYKSWLLRNPNSTTSSLTAFPSSPRTTPPPWRQRWMASYLSPAAARAARTLARKRWSFFINDKARCWELC